MVLLLVIMTQVAIGLVQLHKRAAQAAALTVFTVAAVIALGLMALQGPSPERRASARRHCRTC